MLRKLGPTATLLLLVSLLAAGCGGGDQGDTAKTVTTPTVATSTTGTSTGGVPENLRAGVAACRKSIDDNPQIKDDIKDDLKTICDQVASDDPAALKKATREVCVKIVKSSVPEGDVRDQAEKACAASGD